ncbi:MAG: hypothetical protein H7327_04785 [Herminiimonas sp.]|nr:hypothetical protein [Herminiimonas sp.]
MAQPVAFSFGVIAPGASHASGDAGIREAIVATDAENLAFVVSSGIKTSQENCSDKLLFKRKELFQSAKNGLIVSIAASDWSGCRTATGRSLAIERLSRIRDLFFDDEFSFGASKLPLARQASTPKFRTYVENLRWDIGSMVFATLHLPANNNDFIAAAGRNSEFEDRMIADRDWLHRVFGFAAQKGATGIVLFCDGDPMATPDARGLLGLGARRDGFAEIRKQITTLTGRFNGKVVLIHGQTGDAAGTPTALTWRGNLGDVAVAPGWVRMTVDPSSPAVLTMSTPSSALRTASQ